MVEIAYILLCHRDPEGIVRQVRELTTAGDCVAIHFDRRAPASAYRAIRDALAGNPRVTFAARRVACGWGEWSLVAATLEAVRAAVEAFPAATHFYMISGDCMPIKSGAYARAYLAREGCDYIESFDFFESNWIRTGIRGERLVYRHLFNERKHRWLFYKSLEVQQRLGMTRALPQDLRFMIGSQWWCLRRSTIERILAFIKARPDIVRFFRTVWVPDETFFQTLVAHLIPAAEVRARTLTFLTFTDYGMPATFYNDHADFLLAQNSLFARKISPGATELRKRLGRLYGTADAPVTIGSDGRRLMSFLSGRGRHGRRYAPRFWEAGATIGEGRTLYIVACKKWHVAKRLVHAIGRETGMPVAEYLFTEERAYLPDLGGIETSLAKRSRHRRSFLGLLYAQQETDRLAICVDTSDFDIIKDFCADVAHVRLIEIACSFSDDYLLGHARRVGLTSQAATADEVAELLPAVRYDVDYESHRLRAAHFPQSFRLSETDSDAEKALTLGRFLDIPAGTARAIAATDHLFCD